MAHGIRQLVIIESPAQFCLHKPGHPHVLLGLNFVLDDVLTHGVDKIWWIRIQQQLLS
jgi:hypothetical protein